MRTKQSTGLQGLHGLLVVVSGCVFILPLASAAFWDRFQRNEKTPPVKIAQGQLTGILQTSVGGNKFMAYLGIPYAKPPVGDLRFQAPQPADPWEGVREAHSEGDMCPQKSPAGVLKPQASVKSAKDALKIMASLPGAARFAARLAQMSENCLFLNVFTPGDKLPVDNLMPVLVYIHGGAFMSGSGDTLMNGPEFLMDQGLVLVTINYRVGPFGFLGSNSPDAPGNAGLKDQLLALRWVRDNIRHFGGDPRRITLYGCSAGAASVHLHVLSPKSKGLFQAAILSSGSAQDAWVLQDDPDANSRRLAEVLGAGADTASDVRKRVQFLQDTPWKDVLNATIAIMQERNERAIVDMKLTWAPVVEAGDDGSFLVRHPNDIVQSGDFDANVPLMIGFNNREGTVSVGSLFRGNNMVRLQANPGLLLASNLYERVDANTREQLSGKIRDLYLKGQPIGQEAVNDIADVFGDQVIVHGVHVSTHWHLKHAKAPVYLYYFTLDAFGVMTFLAGNKGLTGAGHGDDQGYVLKNHVLSDIGTAEQDRVELGRSRMTSLVANFVRQRNPTPEKTARLNVEWTPATLESPKYLEIGDNLTLREGNILQERMQFWDETAKTFLNASIYDLQ